MKKTLFIFFLQFYGFLSFASHIVGGEIEIYPLKNPVLGNGTHQVTLSLYFDAINGRVAAEDLSIRLQVFRKKDLAYMGDVVCPQVYRQPIKYIDPTCQKGDLITLLMKYSSAIELKPEIFNDPDGYMIIWERCCRNNIITNIKDPSSVGMVFYTEFAPLQVIDSSPHFRDIIADYACINQNFEMDFSASDAEGDSLVYHLVVPWIGNSSPGNPNPTNMPKYNFREASWVDGIDISNVIPGEIPLKIDSETGVLSVKPNKLGLYVFSVMVEEYRKGVRIGRVKRDFQLKVVECIYNNPPQILVKNQNNKKYYETNEVVTIKKGEKSCFDLLIFDQDINQKLTLTAKGINFDTKKIILPSNVSYTVVSKDTIRATFCLDNCIITKNNIADFFINISDNGCPVPQTRGYRMKILFEENVNTKPSVTTSLLENPVISYGDTLKFTVFGNDIDNDTLFLSGSGRNFSLGSYGFSFPNSQGVGKTNSILSFIPNCEALRQKQVLLDFFAKDLRCGVSSQTIYSVPVKIEGKPNNDPIVTISLANNTYELVLKPNEKNTLTFEVNSQDVDNEQIILNGTPTGFDFKNALMTFESKEGKGTVNSVFAWNPTCFMLGGKDSKEFFVNFRTQDSNCLQGQDSVNVRLVLKDNLVDDSQFKSCNTFTPNGDGKNDFFNMGLVPEDNCKRQFKKFEIFNRWGKTVYTTNERLIQWDGESEASGEYFYVISFTDDIIKGIIHLIR